MKKLLAITLVLGLAAVASAVPVITVNGTAPYQVAMGETLTFTIMNTEAVDPGIFNYSGIAWLDNSPGGQLTGVADPATIGNQGFSMNLTAASDGLDGVYFSAAGTDAANYPTPNAVQFTFTYTALDASSASVIKLSNEDQDLSPMTGANITEIAIQNVPEPMTLGLLGLGGLFLRRRK